MVIFQFKKQNLWKSKLACHFLGTAQIYPDATRVISFHQVVPKLCHLWERDNMIVTLTVLHMFVSCKICRRRVYEIPPADTLTLLLVEPCRNPRRLASGFGACIVPISTRWRMCIEWQQTDPASLQDTIKTKSFSGFTASECYGYKKVGRSSGQQIAHKLQKLRLVTSSIHIEKVWICLDSHYLDTTPSYPFFRLK
jgi:hypothetical protein